MKNIGLSEPLYHLIKDVWSSRDFGIVTDAIAKASGSSAEELRGYRPHQGSYRSIPVCGIPENDPTVFTCIGHLHGLAPGIVFFVPGSGSTTDRLYSSIFHGGSYSGTTVVSAPLSDMVHKSVVGIEQIDAGRPLMRTSFDGEMSYHLRPENADLVRAFLNEWVFNSK